MDIIQIYNSKVFGMVSSGLKAVKYGGTETAVRWVNCAAGVVIRAVLFKEFRVAEFNEKV